MTSKQIKKRLGEIALKLVAAGSGCGGDCEKCRLHQSFSLHLPKGAMQEAKASNKEP